VLHENVLPAVLRDREAEETLREHEAEATNTDNKAAHVHLEEAREELDLVLVMHHSVVVQFPGYVE
jgi:hypothetical protein